MRAWMLAITVCGALVASGAAQTDFEWHGHLAAGQTLEIKGVNGGISATPASSGDAQVTAVKTAHRSNPDEVRVEVVPHAGGVTICAVYPDADGREPNRCEPGSESHNSTHNNDTSVRFEVHVPAGVKFAGRTVNGSIDAESLKGDVEAHTVNGSVKVSTTGLARANTVNGSVTVTAGRTDWPNGAKFSTVNGGITLTLPTSLNASLRASLVNGSITSDFPITVLGEISRRHLEGKIGNGGSELALTTVNGSIKLLKAQ